MKRAVHKELPDAAERARVLKELRRDVLERQQGYRERALRLFPHICAGCGREFTGKRLTELTVHHKDGNWKNNPPDGSNWELLCLYCHDHEHEKLIDARRRGGAASASADPSPGLGNPFEKLDALLEAAGDGDPAGGAPPAGEDKT